MGKIESVCREKFKIDPKQLGLKLGLFGGESGLQNENFRRKLESTFGIIAQNANYGSADSMSLFASENINTRDGLQFLGDGYLKPELYYKGEYYPINNPTTDTGELVISTIYSRGIQNLVRFRIGDIIKLKTFDKNFKFEILGRSDEMIVVKGLNVYPNVLKSVFSELLIKHGLSGNFQVKVSKVDPIEVCEFHTDISDGSFLKELEFELKSKTSIKFIMKISEIEVGDTGKVKIISRSL